MITRRIVSSLLVLLLSVTGVLGVWNGLDDFRNAKTTWQRAVSASVFLYGVAAFVAIAGILKRRKWGLLFVSVWGVSCIFAAFGGTLFYGETDVRTAILAGASVLLVAGPLLWVAAWLIRSP
jgi:uncharacterized membrane protein